MILLGIETSCDETAVALVNSAGQVLSHQLARQLPDHLPYGGVVPEIAARAHLRHLPELYRRAMAEAKLDLSDIAAIAATAGPGLIGGVLVGVMFGRGLAAGANKPFLPINHLEGHALTARLSDGVQFPYLLLLLSGGHSQFIAVHGLGQYELLGTTLDDAAGEAFDKAAKMLGLPYPGGPALEAIASQGDGSAITLPLPLLGRPGCDFSFSGLKTALRQLIDKNQHSAPDIAAAFQHSMAKIITDRARHALAMMQQRSPIFTSLVVAGGVAANQHINAALRQLCDQSGKIFVAPPPAWCTDNAIMIAWAGLERWRAGQQGDMNMAPRPRWPLAELTPPEGTGR